MNTGQQLDAVDVIDDDAAVRNAISLLLKSVGIPVRRHESAAAFLKTFDPDNTACMLVDIRMPGMSGLELQEVLSERRVPVPVIFITGHGDVGMAVNAMKAGAFDFIEKPFRDQDLIDRVNRAIASRREDAREERQREALRARFRKLSPRERQVMTLVATGKANKVIAIELNLSERTVEIHRRNVMRKMNAVSLAELVRLAVMLDL